MPKGIKAYNHYADHMNAFITKHGRSVTVDEHDAETRRYNLTFEVQVPLLSGPEDALRYFIGEYTFDPETLALRCST